VQLILVNLTDETLSVFSSVRAVCAIVLLRPSRTVDIVDTEDRLYAVQYVGTCGGSVEVQSDGSVADWIR
jgi:hypothetical protein